MSACKKCGRVEQYLRHGLCHRDYQRMRLAGVVGSPLVSAQAAREHIAVLVAAGWKYNEITRAAHVARGVPAQITHGREKIAAKTSAAICGIDPSSRAEFIAHIDPAIILARARRAAASLTAETKAERSRKAWVTRRANKLKVTRRAEQEAARQKAARRRVAVQRTRAQITPAEVLAALAMPRQDWRDDALCAQVDTEIFFPEKGGSTTLAMQVCAACPVRAECLRWAVDSEEQHGVWGGKSPRQRQELRRRAA